MKQHPKYFHIFVSKKGEIFSNLSGKLRRLKTRVDEFGYRLCGVTIGDGKSKTMRVHRLVAETYLPNPLNLREVDHLDCDKLNNNLSNLEWVSSKENKRRAKENGLYDKNIGVNHYKSFLTVEEVEGICQDLQDGLRNKDISEIHGVSADIVIRIKRRDNWKSVSCDYDFSVKRCERKPIALIRALCLAIQQGKSNKEIYKDFDGKVEVSEIQRIRAKKTHAKISDSYF